ncbi:hypothetical protein V1291_003925 [Nitrobacteraceae bacterium AZCC 1564]
MIRSSRATSTARDATIEKATAAYGGDDGSNLVFVLIYFLPALLAC